MSKHPEGYKTVNGKTYFQEAIRNYLSFQNLFPIEVKDAQERFIDKHINDRNMFGFKKFRSRTACRDYLHLTAADNWLNIEEFLFETGHLSEQFMEYCDCTEAHRTTYSGYMNLCMSMAGTEDCSVSTNIMQAVEFWESEKATQDIQELWECLTDTAQQFKNQK